MSAEDGGRSAEERERARLERERRRIGARGETPPPVSAQPAPPPRPRDIPPSPSPSPPPPSPSLPPPSPSPSPSPPPPLRGSDQPFDSPRPPRPVHANRKRAVALVALATAVLVILWLVSSVYQPFAGDGKGTGAVQIQIPHGANVHQIGTLLAAGKVIGSASVFSWRASQSGKSNEFKAGRYRFGRGMSYSAAITLLAKGPNAGVKSIIVIEGRSRHEIAQQAASLGIAGDYMAASKSSRLLSPRRYGVPRSVRSLEGFLFPATYELATGTTADRLVAQQLQAFKRNIGSVNMRYARSKNLTTFDIVTIASLIEREVQVPRERKLVAAVIYNRLKRGIPLGIDATTRFETNNWTAPLTNAQLTKNTPYNTRTRHGLPPGPIGNPGLASLQAAADPAKVGYLYYVVNPCKPGSHSFSSTYARFQQDVQRYQRARDAAGGKQPSGC